MNGACFSMLEMIQELAVITMTALCVTYFFSASCILSEPSYCKTHYGKFE